MKRLLVLAIGFISCTQPTQTTEIEITDTEAVRKVDTPTSQHQQPQDTVVNYDRSIYSHYIAADVMNLLNRHLPQWELPDPSSWDAYWFNEYKKDSALVNYISGDFNCDGKPDYCFLLSHAKEGFAVWVLHTTKGTYEAVKLEELGPMETPIEIGLLFTEAGQLDYLDEQAADTKSITIKCPAISVVFFEKAAVTYYWENGKYREVQTGD